jgi:hypothetical protein
MGSSIAKYVTQNCDSKFDGSTAEESLNMSTAPLARPNPTEIHFKARDGLPIARHVTQNCDSKFDGISCILQVELHVPLRCFVLRKVQQRGLFSTESKTVIIMQA